MCEHGDVCAAAGRFPIPVISFGKKMLNVIACSKIITNE